MKKSIIISLTIVLLIIVLGASTYLILKNKNSKVMSNKLEYYKDGYRFKKEKISADYYMNFGCYTELDYTERYYLFELYKFLNLPKEEQIKPDNYNMSIYGDKLLVMFFDKGKQYKITDDYCIDEAFNENNWIEIKKVQCEKRAIPIEKLPYERSIAFTKSSKKGTYYVDYDIKNLWKEFDTKGIKGLEQDMNNEYEKIGNWHDANCNWH